MGLGVAAAQAKSTARKVGGREQRRGGTTAASGAYAEMMGQHLRGLPPPGLGGPAAREGLLSLGDGAELPGHG